MTSLFEKIKHYIDISGESFAVPDYIKDNLKHKLWWWQESALQYFTIYEHRKEKFVDNIHDPTHLMFNMATGTGKTMLMSALILHFYTKGYRHFIFFTNQNVIVGKTEENFVNPMHAKYVFSQTIVIDDKTVHIRKVETFDDRDDIQIKFTSIQKLHNAVYIEKENSVTLEELHKKDLILIGDEAHHLNTETLRTGQGILNLPQKLTGNASTKDIERSWENTVVQKILWKNKTKSNTENRNVLLEFTATIPKNPHIIEKYHSKTIYQFELIDFLKAGYTKEINLISTSLEKKEKILLALLFNWYRHRIALINNITNFKPVILFRSKYIEDSKNDYAEFLNIINNLQPSDFDFMKHELENSIREDTSTLFKVYDQGRSRIKQMLAFIKQEKVNRQKIVQYIKYEFAEKNCIITNSKSNKATTQEKISEEQEQLLNSLEDDDNHIRAIFSVKRLTEGWDVLNLFDIVRLYEGRDEGRKDGKRIAGRTTIQEVQLIGRGVRYYPFSYNDCIPNKRKFDDDVENPLRILEEFYYHSDNNVKYLDELKRELKNTGLISEDREIKQFALKDDFKQSDFFQEFRLWKNKRIENPERRKRTLNELKLEPFEYKLSEFSLKEEHIDLDNTKTDTIRAESKKTKWRILFVRIVDFEKHIIAKAITIKTKKDSSILRFNNLKEDLDIQSIEDLLSDAFIGNFEIKIFAPQNIRNLNDIAPKEQLDMLLKFFENFTQNLQNIANPHKGTEEFYDYPIGDLFGEVREKSVVIDPESKMLESELLEEDWYVLNGFNGTSEERELLEFVKNRIVNLEESYKEVYVLRNEEVYKIYDFKMGRGFAPDFLLLLQGTENNEYYQIFIEPKGEQFLGQEGGYAGGKEGWKEVFLQQISDKYGNGFLLKAENAKYNLIGLPLYSKKTESKFDAEFIRAILK